jgi:hypothetical protein
VNDPTKVSLPKELAEGMKVHINLRQDMIIITADRAKLCLFNHLDGLTSRAAWVAPCGLLVAFVAALVAADFKDALGLKKDVWMAIFVISAALSSIWLALALVSCVRSWSRSKSGSPVDDLINEMKAATKEAARIELDESRADKTP